MKNTYSLSHKKILRTVALITATLMLLVGLVSCKARRLLPSDEALASVGIITVGNPDGSKTEYTVPYEEFYFLAKSYAPSVAERYEVGSEQYNEALMQVVSENITANYAILALCADMELFYNEEELRDAVKDEIESIIDEAFGGSRKNYLDSIKEEGMTDHYMRFVLGVDLLYSKLPMLYTQKGLVPNTESKIKEYIEENYICTKHILIFNDEYDDAEQNLANAEAVRQLLLDGKSINEIIGGKHMNVNEDLLIPYDGYYFSKGTMEKEYENAAFSLDIGGVSEVVTSTAKNNSGDYVECYYVIQRMPLDAKDIDKHFADLGDSIAASIIANKLDELDGALTFVPNDYARSLDMSALSAPKAETDIGAITVAAVCGGVAIIIAAVVIILSQRHKKKLANARALKDGSTK